MPPPIDTVENIRDRLNQGLANPVWFVLPELYTITTATINNGVISFNPANGIILRAFVNTQTAEIKTFVAKYLDTPNRELL